MIKWRKTAWWIAGVLALSLLGALALHSVFDKAQLKALARDKVRAAWARDLLIGDLSLQLMPFPALHAKDITLSNPSWARNRNLLEAASVTAQLELLPLLSGQLSISALSIDGLKLNPEVSFDGRKSWDIHSAGTGRSGAANAEAIFDPLRLTAVHVQGAQINYLSGAVQRVWRIDEFGAEGEPGWRDVRIEAGLSRNGHRMQLKGEFADLSRIGVKGAVTEGAIQLQSGQARLDVAGKIPLEASLQKHVVKAEFEAASLTEALGFFGIRSGPVAPLKASADLHESGGKINAENLAISLGRHSVTGRAQLALARARPNFDAQLATDRLDWAQAWHDAGRPAPPPRLPGELFRTHTLAAWPLLVAMQSIEGTLDTQINSLRLRSGIEVRNAKAHMALKGDRLNISAFSANLLGGTASGNVQLDGRKKNAKLNVEATNISLGQWFTEIGKKMPLSGGPMNIDASVSATGASMKDLAASLTGPVTIRIGEAKIRSRQLQQAETLLIGLAPMFSSRDADQVDLTCVSARLPFAAGRASAEPLAGMRSDTSQLLTSGFVDLRRQTLDLRGRVKARSGVNLGVSTLAGDIRIAGKILQPEVNLDPSGTPATLARLGAAIVTGGASILVTAIWDAANPASDPCQIALAKTVKPGAARPTKGPVKAPHSDDYAANQKP